MRSFKKKAVTAVLAGVMIVANLVQVSAVDDYVDFTVGGHEFEGYASCNSYSGSAETEHVCFDDCMCHHDVSATVKLYVIDGEDGDIETMINYDYSEGVDLATITCSLSVEERDLYVLKGIEAHFSADVGTTALTKMLELRN